MKLLLDEMYPAALATRLQQVGIDATTVAALGLTARPDAEVFAAAVADRYAVLTENVKDFTRLAADAVLTGRRHGGLLIALSSRFSRRPAGIAALVAAVKVVEHDELADRVVFLARR